MESQHGIIVMKPPTQPTATHQPTGHQPAAHLFLTHRCRGYIGGILRVSGECLNDVSWVSGGVLRVSGRCLESVWRFSWNCLYGCLVSDWKVFGGCMKRVFGKMESFFGLQLFDTYGKDTFATKIFWTQNYFGIKIFLDPNFVSYNFLAPKSSSA